MLIFYRYFQNTIMGLLKIALVLMVSCSSLYSVKCHSYHFGQCPTLEPMSDFSMDKVSHNVWMSYDISIIIIII